MPKRTRDRQLAKLAARRQEERARRKRRRDRIMGVVAAAVAVVVVAFLALSVFNGNGTDQGSATPSASQSASPSASLQVACGGTVPKTAGEKKPTYPNPPKMTIDTNKTYLATMVTSCGTIEMKLDPKVAPQGVNNFVFLADQGFYDGTTFHRIVKDFVIQGGDPEGTGKGGPGYGFAIETDPSATFDRAGVVAYANSGPGTNGSQFFITLAPTPNLDPPQGSYTIFGHVVKGMDVVNKIGKIPGTPNPGIPGENSVPTQTVYVEKVTIDVTG